MKASSMVFPLSNEGGHSTRLNVQLLRSGFVLTIPQMRPDFVLMDAPINHEAASATIVMQVDECEPRWNVHLPEGISAEDKRVRIATIT